MAVLKTDTRRESLLKTISELEQEHAELLAAVVSAPGREHAARVQALESNPAQRSDAKGAASPVRKIREQLGRDEARLANVELELAAARSVLAFWNGAAAVEERAEHARREAERLAAEAEIIAARKAAQTTFPAAAPAGAVVAVRRDDPSWRGQARVTGG